MTNAADRRGPMDRYTMASQQAASRIIGSYSTSFGTATRLLGVRHRSSVRNVYALVRVADELVDGVTAEAGFAAEQQHRALDQLEQHTLHAIDSGYSSNPIVHAFAHTARRAGIERRLITPFFASMRTDLPRTEPVGSGATASGTEIAFGAGDHADYVHGSAEVVGLMCLRIFLCDEDRTPEQLTMLEHGARRLGAAFQNVNFLRDLSDDTDRLGRCYLSPDGTVDESVKDHWVRTIREQLADAAATIELLPRDARVAVYSALRLFSRLTDRIAATSVENLYRRRVRVPAWEKSVLVARSLAEHRRRVLP